jgi:pimeloyl-ACP methyl ester carboxylesterase
MLMSHSPRSILTLVPALLTFATGCTSLSQRPPQTVEPPPANVEAVVFSVSGAGGFQATTQALRQAVAETGRRLHVESVVWSHGYGRILADQTDECHAREEGRCLAERVENWRRQFPDKPVYLVGHSAGSAVVLAAAEALPPNSVERIVLLAPSVSASYDLRPALSSARQGIDAFHSERDWVYLGLGTGLVGTADRRWESAAGRVGFRVESQSPEDSALYAKLRQHPWDRCVEWTGNRGGHYGPYQSGFLRAYVLPLFDPPGERGR